MLLLYIQQGEYTDRPLVADDVPRGRHRALVVASLGCGTARVVHPRAVAGDHPAKGSQNHGTTPADTCIGSVRCPRQRSDGRWPDLIWPQTIRYTGT